MKTELEKLTREIRLLLCVQSFMVYSTHSLLDYNPYSGFKRLENYLLIHDTRNKQELL